MPVWKGSFGDLGVKFIGRQKSPARYDALHPCVDRGVIISEMMNACIEER